MDFEAIENVVVSELGRALRRKALVQAGPSHTPPLAGMQPTVFVHAARFEDFEGVTANGAQTTRRRVRQGRRWGMGEERPARLSLEVTGIASAYNTVQALGSVLTPRTLLALRALKQVDLTKLPPRFGKLSFEDFSCHLALAESSIQVDDELRYHSQRLVFELNGFLHCWTPEPTPPKKSPAKSERTVRSG